jgi:uncharacterized protein involved in exopolysaccharide biosynthesis
MDAGIYLRTILRRKKFLFYWVITGIFIAIVAYFIQPPVYKVVSKWYVKKASADRVLSQGINVGDTAPIRNIEGLLFDNYNKSAVYIDAAILLSPDVLREIIKRADLKDENGKYLSVEGFRKIFQVSVDEALPFIIVKFFFNDQYKAYEVIQIAEEVFVDKNISAEAKKAELNRMFLEKQVEEAREKAMEASENLREYEKQSNIVNLDLETKANIKNNASLEVQRASYQAELNSINKKIIELKRKLQMISPGQAIDKSTIASDLNIKMLRQKLVEENSTLIKYKAKYTDNHPSIKEKEDEILSLKSEIEERHRQITGKFSPAEKIEDTGEVKGLLISQYVTLSTEREAMQSRISSIDNTLNDYRERLNNLPVAKYDFSKLVFEDEFNKTRLENLKIGLEAAKINEAFAKNTISIVKIDETRKPTPLEPWSPAFPNIYLNLIAGIILGCLAGYTHIIIASAKDTKIRYFDQLENLCNLSVKEVVKLDASKSLKDNVLQVNGYENDLFEVYRRLRAILKSHSTKETCQIVTFLNPDYSAYYTIVLLNLARHTAFSGYSVLFIDANGRIPQEGTLFELDKEEQGLSDFLKEPESSVHDMIKNTRQVQGLSVILAGTKPEVLPDMLNAEKLNSILKTIKGYYNFIFINLPSYNDCPEAEELAALADKAFLSLVSDMTDVQSFIKLQDRVSASGVDVAGCLFINMQR